MKRFLVLLLALSMFLMTAAVAEETGIDLSGKTVDELLAIQKAVNDALYEQGGKVILPQGELLVGRDIAAGSYYIEPHNVREDYHGWSYNLTIWKTATSKAEYEAAESARYDAYRQAKRDEEAGKEATYPPDSTDWTLYAVVKDAFTNTVAQRITLEEGQVLEFSVWSNDPTLEMTIEKQGGLFMD